MNGYILSKWKFKGSDVIFTFILFGMFIPYQSILIPLIQFLRDIELYNTIPGLILVHVVYGLPITTLMFRNFYASIPDEMIESAQIDGANFLEILAYYYPLIHYRVCCGCIWQFTNIWNEFLFAVTITTGISSLLWLHCKIYREAKLSNGTYKWLVHYCGITNVARLYFSWGNIL